MARLWRRMLDRMRLTTFLYSQKQYYMNYSVCNELKKYKNVHKGKRCFVIGTGPSLTPDDLEKLQGEITFGSNRIFEMFDRTDWRPTYYINQDYKLICKFAREIKDIRVARKFLPVDVRSLMGEEKNVSYFVLRHKDFYPGESDFSVHINRFVGQGFTVTYGAIQIAYYMGFSKVFLLGIDHNYSVSLNEKGVPVVRNDVKDYFEGSKASNVDLNLPRVTESTIAYQTARKFADSHRHFTIYNATRGGKLEAFERVDLDETLQKTD